VDELEAAILAVLRKQAGDLGARWTLQAHSVLLLDQTNDQKPEHVGDAEGLVDALVGDGSSSDGVPEDSIGHGLRFGASAFARGVSLHHVLKGLDLLTAMTLYAMESAIGQLEVPTANAADGIRLSRRLQSRAALLSLAATRGYMQAFAETLREGFRHLRHDLRNPLGTIKSVLALMDDESVPLEARVNPSFRAMATRNARSLEELIADRLSDAAALLPVVAGQDVSVRAIACAVRRELRAEAERRGVSILVDQGGAHGRMDAAGLELLLRSALQVALRECESGDKLRLGFEQPAGRAAVVISCESGRSPIRDASTLDHLGTLAGQIGAMVVVAEHVVVSIPLGASDDNDRPATERERSLPREPGGLSDGETRHDVRGTRESHHGQAGAH
jgi:signal transduction histidine kinase